MTCKNCGSAMVPGQLICSNCDTDNSSYVSNDENIVNNTNYETDNYINIEENNITYENKEVINNDFVKDTSIEKNSKSHFKVIIIILLLLIIIPFIVFGVITLVFQRNVDINEVNQKNSPFIEEYKIIKKDMQVRSNLNQEITCKKNCFELYDYDSSKYSLEIIDNDLYYKIKLKNNDKDDPLNDDLCSQLDNTICEENEIIGRIYKENYEN